MSLQQWLNNSWIRRTEPSGTGVSDRLAIAKRQIADARLEGISTDGRFNHAYDAIRTLCELTLYASGYIVPKGVRQHERAIQSLKFTVGGDCTEQADYFDRCRRLRHQSTYERSGVVQQKDSDELLQAANKLYGRVQEWLRRQHPELL